MYCYALTHSDGSFYKSITGAVYVDFCKNKKQAEFYFKLQLLYDRFVGLCKDKSEFIVKQISLDTLDWFDELKKVKKEVDADSNENLKEHLKDEMYSLLCTLEKFTIKYKVTVDMILQEAKILWRTRVMKKF